ncbi:MAG: flagellar hook-associated protein FlgL [Firmicutes bacterium]|nr:flagellar hook-associated protein FlgL [Bacillota bacterium]
MRVTHRMLAQSVSRNVRDNLTALERKAVQLSSGRCFHRPSHDPAGVYKVMRLTGTGLYRNEQYQRNIGEGITWLTITEDALIEAVDIVQRLKELAVYAATGTLTPADRELIAPEVEELFDHLVSIGNTELGGLYIFGGHQTQTPPYEKVEIKSEAIYEKPENIYEYIGIKYAGDKGAREIEITPSQKLTINLTGIEFFGGERVEGEEEEKIVGAGTDLFLTVRKFINILRGTNGEAVGGEEAGAIIGELEKRMDHLLQQGAQVGARVKRLQSTEQRLKGEHIHLRELRSKIEDLDLAAAITELTMQENAYHAALATGARMIYPSLIDFLR